jgi:hypothetical protein
MSRSGELRAEIAHLRNFLRDVTDQRARRAVLDMIRELEQRARELDNGSAES